MTADQTPAVRVVEDVMWNMHVGPPHDMAVEFMQLLQSAPESDRRLLAAALLTPDMLATALVAVEEQKVDMHPACLDDTCDHNECPDWGALGCGDAAYILVALGRSE